MEVGVCFVDTDSYADIYAEMDQIGEELECVYLVEGNSEWTIVKH